MPEFLTPLAEGGAWALSVLGIPVAVWTVASLAALTVLRLRTSIHPLLALGARRALLWSLPAGILAALAAPGWLAAAASERMADAMPVVLTLPTLTIGAPPETGPLAPEAVPVVALLAGIALGVAALVAAVRLGSLGLSLVRLGRLSSGTAFDASVQREATRIAQREGLRRPLRARTTVQPTVPYTYGWRRPVVVVPAPLAADPPQLRLVLAHEIAHVARGDFASGVAERIVGAVFGWHPLVGLLIRSIDLDRERATDAAVLAHRPAARRDYATLLLSFSRLPSPALALGAARGPDALTARITTMQTSPLPPRALRRRHLVARALGALLFTVAVGSSFVLSVSPPEALAATTASTDVAPPPAAVSAPPPEASGDERAAEATPEAQDLDAPLAIRGTVRDVTTNAPIAGANVLVIGTTIGAATNARGEFTLTGVDAGDIVLRVTTVGYVPITFRPQTTEPLAIGLIPDDPSQRMAAPPARTDRDSGAPVPEVFEVVEQPPVLIGGTASLAESLVYPPEAKEDGVEGTVMVRFVVNTTGGVDDAECIRSPDDRLCEAALSAVSQATFEPGRQRGEAVKVRFVLPIRFALPDTD